MVSGYLSKETSADPLPPLPLPFDIEGSPVYLVRGVLYSRFRSTSWTGGIHLKGRESHDPFVHSQTPHYQSPTLVYHSQTPWTLTHTHILQSLTKVVLPVWFQAFDLITAIHVLWPTAHSSFWVLSNSFEDCLPDLLLGLDDYFGFALVCLTALQFSSNSCIQISTSHLTIRLKLWQLWYLFKVIKGFANFSLEILV